MKNILKIINRLCMVVMLLVVSSIYTTANAQCAAGCGAPEEVYIASIDNDGAGGNDCNEYVEICYHAPCACSPDIDISGWELEDAVSNDGSPVTTVNIISGSLMPGECVQLTSANLELDAANGGLGNPGSVTGSMGSTIMYGSDRDDCPVWNNGGDDIFLYDGDSQAAGTNLIDSEVDGDGADGMSTFTAPTSTCPAACEVTCPDFSTVGTGMLDANITESTCPAGDAAPSGGSVAAPTMMCPTGSTLEYSLDAFATAGTTTPPAYNQTTAITVSTRCVCDDDMTMTSMMSTVTTVPGECAMCDAAITAATPSITIDSESTCAMAGGMLMGGAISAATCPTGSTVEYSTDGGASWSATLPTYDQNNSISVTARCVCDIDDTMVGTGTAVATTPGTCPPPAEACNECDCDSANAPADSYTINTVADNGSQAGYTLTYTLTGNGDPLETDTPAAAMPASFPGLADNTPYDVCAFNVLDTDLAAFQAALTNEAAVADAMAGTGAFMSLCYTQVCMNFPAEDCQCVTCPDFAAAGNEAPPVMIDSEAGCDTSTDPFTTIVGVTSDVTATCPAGSTLEYSFDMGATWVATFMDTYDQTMPVEIRTRCVCDSDMSEIGPETIVMTNPQEGCPAEVCPACDCSASPNSYTINTTAVPQTGYTLVYGLTGAPTYMTTATSPASFPGLEDNTAYEVCVFNVVDAEAAAFQAALTDETAHADAVLKNPPFDTFCYEVACMPFMENCDCCPDIAATLSGEGQICTSGDVAAISVEIMGGIAPYTVVYSDGTANTTVTGYNNNDAITPSPTSTAPGATTFTYTLVSVVDANGCTSTVDGTGTITVQNSCADAGGFNRN